MARFFQYQNKTEPVTVPAAAAAVFAIAVTAEVFFPRSIVYQSKAEPVFVPTAEEVTLDKWYEPLAEPVRIKRTQQGQVLAFVPTVSATGTGVATETISGGALFPRSFIYQSTAYNPFPITAETITVDKWFNPLTEPVRVKRFPTSEQQALAFQYPFPTAPIGAVPTSLEGPPSSVRLLQYQSVAFPVPVFENITVDKWFAPLSDPVRTRRLPTAEQQAFVGSPFTPEVITVDKWFEPLAEPTRRKPREARQPTAQAPFIEDAAILTKWFRPLSEPVRTRRFPASEQQSLAWSTFTPTAVTFYPMVFGDTGLTIEKTIVYQVSAETPIEDIYESKWHQPWSEPLRIRKTAHLQPVLNWSGFTPAAETIFEDKWHQAWSDPVRVRRFPTSEQRAYFAPEATLPRAEATIATAQMPSVVFPRSIIYQSVAWSPYPITAPTFTYFSMVQGDTGLTFERTIVYQVSAETPVEDIFEDKWHQPWSEPVRRKGLRTDKQQALAWSGFTPTPEIITEDKWHQAWSEPVRVKARLRQYPDFFWHPSTPAATGTGVATSSLASQPVFPRSIIYQSIAWAPYPVSVEVITEDKWHQPWSEPVRTKRFPSAEQQAWAGPVFVQPIFPGSWYEPFSEPVRKKRGLPAYEQQTFAFWPQPIITFGYYNWLSEPVRLKKGLRKDLQPTVAEPPQYPNLFRIIPWFKPLEEPVRQKRGIRAWLQQFFTAGTEPITNVVTVVIDATETNNDTAQFYAVVYNRPTRCYISIKEVRRRDDANVSFEET